MVEPLTDEKRSKYVAIFNQNRDESLLISGTQAKAIFQQSGLDNGTLSEIWMLADVDGDGKLTQEEFCIAMHLIMFKKRNPLEMLPFTLPNHLLPSGFVQSPPLALSTPTPPQQLMSTSLSSTDLNNSMQGPWAAAPPLPLSRGSSFQNTPPIAISTPPVTGAQMTPPLPAMGSNNVPPTMHLGQPARNFSIEQELQKEDETLRYKISHILNAMRQSQELIDKEVLTLDERQQHLVEARNTEKTLAKQQEELEQLKEQLITFGARIENLVTESTSKGDKLGKQNANLQREIDDLRAEQHRNRVRVEASVQLGAEAEQHLASLHATLAEVDTVLRNTGIAVSDLESQVTHLQASRHTLQDEVEQQNHRFENMLTQAKTLVEQRDALQEDTSALEARLAEITSKLGVSMEEQEKEKMTIIELTTKHSELRREINCLSLAGRDISMDDRVKYEASLKAAREHLRVLKEIEDSLGINKACTDRKDGWDTDWADTSADWDKGFSPPTVTKQVDNEIEVATPTSWGFHSPSIAAPREFATCSAEWGFTPDQQEPKPQQSQPQPEQLDFGAPPIPCVPQKPSSPSNEDEWFG
eukprot:TRINITY_DN4017_c0_g1_i2.p1 TRINITY_DN4017_c0_g1~~TRINITY_DN4017_c0_g1_i2.p1  ORF type:complete len:594 (+),score=134.39 TRINITY_DN4017_c0_g1_i2:29-1783(+)